MPQFLDNFDAALTNIINLNNPANPLDAANKQYVDAQAGTGGVRKYATTIGDGVATAYFVSHNLGTTDVVVTVYRSDDGNTRVVLPNIYVIDANTLWVVFARTAPQNVIRVVVVG